MSREEKIEILRNYYGTRALAETLVDKGILTDEDIMERMDREYVPMYND